MSNKTLPKDPSGPTPGEGARDNVVNLRRGAFVSKASNHEEDYNGGRQDNGDERCGRRSTAHGPSTPDPGFVPPALSDDPHQSVKSSAFPLKSVDAGQILEGVSGSLQQAVGFDLSRSKAVRRRMNAAASPILEAFARCQGLASKRLLGAIGSPTPLTHPVVVRELGGALHSQAMRSAIAANADPALVPLQVRAGLAKLMAQDLATLPSGEAKEAFSDWDKPLVPAGHHHPAWHARDAVAWLKHFPPVRRLPVPLDSWDDATAACWLNDRASIATAQQDESVGDVVVGIDEANPWKPSLEVLHTLDEIEVEELAYRVFIERLRREVMPRYVSERRILVRDAILHVTFGYQTLQDARRRVLEHDLKRVRLFDRLFGSNCEWIYDLCSRIVDAYAWPSGFAEPELWSEFPDLVDMGS